MAPCHRLLSITIDLERPRASGPLEPGRLAEGPAAGADPFPDPFQSIINHTSYMNRLNVYFNQSAFIVT